MKMEIIKNTLTKSLVILLSAFILIQCEGNQGLELTPEEQLAQAEESISSLVSGELSYTLNEALSQTNNPNLTSLTSAADIISSIDVYVKDPANDTAVFESLTSLAIDFINASEAAGEVQQAEAESYRTTIELFEQAIMVRDLSTLSGNTDVEDFIKVVISELLDAPNSGTP